jgi:hypothetical protein
MRVRTLLAVLAALVAAQPLLADDHGFGSSRPGRLA